MYLTEINPTFLLFSILPSFHCFLFVTQSATNQICHEFEETYRSLYFICYKESNNEINNSICYKELESHWFCYFDTRVLKQMDSNRSVTLRSTKSTFKILSWTVQRNRAFIGNTSMIYRMKVC